MTMIGGPICNNGVSATLIDVEDRVLTRVDKGSCGTPSNVSRAHARESHQVIVTDRRVNIGTASTAATSTPIIRCW